LEYHLQQLHGLANTCSKFTLLRKTATCTKFNTQQISQTNLFGSSACSVFTSEVSRGGGASGGNTGAAIGNAGGGNGGGKAFVFNCISHDGRGMLSHRENE
jgi:hypothetical protein